MARTASTRSPTCCWTWSKRCACSSPAPRSRSARKNPDRFIKRAAKIIRTGFGQPSIFNADLIVQELVRMGKDVVDARCGGSSGLRGGRRVWQGELQPDRLLQPAQGASRSPCTTASTRAPASRSACKPATRQSSPPLTSCSQAFEQQIRHFVDIKVRGNKVIERLYATYMPAPFLSLLIDDCIAQRQGLSRRRRALQHHLHPGRWPGHDHRLPVGAQVPRLRAEDISAWASCWPRWKMISPGTSGCASCCSTAPRATATTMTAPTG